MRAKWIDYMGYVFSRERARKGVRLQYLGLLAPICFLGSAALYEAGYCRSGVLPGHVGGGIRGFLIGMVVGRWVVLHAVYPVYMVELENDVYTKSAW